MLEILSKIIKSNQQNLIIAGDLNTTVYSYAYKKTLKNSGINNTNNLFTGSWPAHFPVFLRIKIDNILVAGNITVQKFKTGKNTGSDHLPIFAIINLP